MMMMNDGSEDGLKHQDVSWTYIGMPSHFPVPSGSEYVCHGPGQVRAGLATHDRSDSTGPWMHAVRGHNGACPLTASLSLAHVSDPPVNGAAKRGKHGVAASRVWWWSWWWVDYRKKAKGPMRKPRVFQVKQQQVGAGEWYRI